MASNHTKEITSVLLVDFDNIYISLASKGKHIANEFANNPDKWLTWLMHGNKGEHNRRILVRRCFMNPQSFSEFRPFLIKSAFEVVDCPPVTARGKTSTDIHLVMHALDLLNHSTRFDEFIIFSGDTDFAPLLVRLRMHDRRTTVFTIGNVSPAYKSAADTLLDEEDFIRDGLGVPYQEEDTPKPAPVDTKEISTLLAAMAERVYQEADLPQGIVANELPTIYREFQQFKDSEHWLGYFSLRNLTESLIRSRQDLEIVGDDPWSVRRKHTEENGEDQNRLKRAIAKWIRDIVSKSPAPVVMASLADGVTQNYGPNIRTGNWLGTGSFKALLLELDLGGLKLLDTVPGFVYDPERHVIGEQAPSKAEPETAVSHDLPASEFSLRYPTLAPLAWKIHRLTDTPYLLPEHYQILFKEIAREINENEGYQWTRTSKKVRDRCVEKEISIGRSHVNFILTGLMYSSFPFKVLPIKPGELAEALVENTTSLCKNAQFIPSETEIELIRQWISAGEEAAPPAQSDEASSPAVEDADPHPDPLPTGEGDTPPVDEDEDPFPPIE